VEPVNKQPPKSLANTASLPALTGACRALWFVCSVAGARLATLGQGSMNSLVKVPCVTLARFLYTLFWLAAPLLAAGPGDATAIPRRLTLAEAEALLLQRNLAVVASRYQIEASRAARLIASYKPNLVLTVGAEQIPFYTPLKGTLPRFFATDSNAGANPVYTFRIDKITERGGKRELRTAQADFQLKATEAQMLDAIRTQLLQLRQAFASAMLAHENLRLAESTQQEVKDV